MKHIVIAANPYRDSGLQKALTVYRMLTEHGHRVVMSPVFAPKTYLPGDVPVRPLEAAAHDAACAAGQLCFGGLHSQQETAQERKEEPDFRHGRLRFRGVWQIVR